MNKGKYKRHPKFVYKEPTWFNATDENNAPDLVPGSEKKLLYAVTSKEKNCAMANILNTFKVLHERAAPRELASVEFKNFNTVRDNLNESGYKIVLIDIKLDFGELSNVLSEHRLPMMLELELEKYCRHAISIVPNSMISFLETGVKSNNQFSIVDGSHPSLGLIPFTNCNLLKEIFVARFSCLDAHPQHLSLKV